MYRKDNGVYKFQGFKKIMNKFKQKLTFSGVGTHGGKWGSRIGNWNNSEQCENDDVTPSLAMARVLRYKTLAISSSSYCIPIE